MSLLLAVCCLLGAISTGDGWTLIKKRPGFSLIALPFKYHGIAPEYVDVAPNRLLEVIWLNGRFGIRIKVILLCSLSLKMNEIGGISIDRNQFGHQSDGQPSYTTAENFMELQYRCFLYVSDVRCGSGRQGEPIVV